MTHEYEVWVHVPTVLCVVEAKDKHEARKLALDAAQGNLGNALVDWPLNSDIQDVIIRRRKGE